MRERKSKSCAVRDEDVRCSQRCGNFRERWFQKRYSCYFLVLKAEALCDVGQVFCILIICHELVVEGFVVDHEL